MANERTLLAYLRTGLMLIVSGVTIYKLLPHEGPVVMGLAWVLFVAGVGTLTFGGRRFWQQRRRLADIR